MIVTTTDIFKTLQGDVVRRVSFVTVVILGSMTICRPVCAQTYDLTQTFNDPTPTSVRFNGDEFGSSVAIDGNNVLIGARGDDTNGSNVGQAHLFDATTGNIVRTFDDPTPTSADQFGFSVTIDGNNALIADPGNDTTGMFSNDGQAHLFDATTGNLLQTFDNPSPASSDFFGFSAAIDGNNVLIGVPEHRFFGNSIGRAHLFDATTGNLLQTFDDPTPTTNDEFGTSVAIDGNNVLIGAYRHDTTFSNVGQAHLFDATTGNLLQTFDDPTPASNDEFGISVAIAGNNVLIGAPNDGTNGSTVGQAYLFDSTTGNLLETFGDPIPAANHEFGYSVAIAGNNVLIGAPNDGTNGSTVGQAYLFDSTTGNLLETFGDPTPTTDDEFGSSVAIDGNNVLIGAPHDDANGTNVGQAYLFNAVPEPTSFAMFGIAMLGLSRRRRQR